MKLTPLKKILKNIKVGDIFICYDTKYKREQKYNVLGIFSYDGYIKLGMSLGNNPDWTIDINKKDYFNESFIVNERYKWYIK